jgi:hypothetical protein
VFWRLHLFDISDVAPVSTADDGRVNRARLVELRDVGTAVVHVVFRAPVTVRLSGRSAVACDLLRDSARFAAFSSQAKYTNIIIDATRGDDQQHRAELWPLVRRCEATQETVMSCGKHTDSRI